MLFFKNLASRILAFFFYKTSNFHFFFDIVIQFFPDPGARKPPYGFDNNVLKNFYWLWNRFQLFNHKVKQFFDKTCNFFQVF